MRRCGLTLYQILYVIRPYAVLIHRTRIIFTKFLALERAWSGTVSNVVFDSDGYYISDTGDCFLPINEYHAEKIIAINEAGVLVTPQGSNTRG